MKNKIISLHEKKYRENVREMVEYIGAQYKGRTAFKYRKNPHDKEPISVSYEAFRDEIQARVDEAHSAVRFCTSWATIPENVDRLIEDIKALYAREECTNDPQRCL